MANISRASSKFGEKVALSGAPLFTQGENIIDLIIKDHRHAEDLYESFKNAPNLEEKTKLRNRLVKTLVQHDEVEQLLVYPLLREKIGGDVGESHYERSLNEHQELRNLMYGVRYSDAKIDSPQFQDKIQKAMDYVLFHVQQEENDVLPLLKKHLTEEELKKVGASFVAHKPTAVTRPHPNAPAQGYPAAVANLVMKPFDLARDIWEGEN